MDKENCKIGRFPLNPMIHYISKITKANFRATLAEHNLFPGQDEILLVVLFYDGIKPSQIAKRMNTSLASISVSLKRLEKAGFIEKKQDEKDARITRVYINKKGKEAMADVRKSLSEYENKMLDGFDFEEKEQLKGFLDRLIFNISGEEDFSKVRFCFMKDIKEDDE